MWRMMAHAHAVCTRSSFSLPLRGPGDEASTRGNYMYTCTCLLKANLVCSKKFVLHIPVSTTCTVFAGV